MKQYTATANDEGVRLSRFVQSVTRDFPTSLLYKSFRNKRIKVNGKRVYPKTASRPATSSSSTSTTNSSRPRVQGQPASPPQKAAEPAQGDGHLRG